MPTIGSLTVGSMRLSPLVQGRQDLVLPALEAPAKLPHPSVRRPRELIDYIVAVLRATYRIDTPNLGRGAYRLSIGLLLQTCTPVREPHRQGQQQVDQR